MKAWMLLLAALNAPRRVELHPDGAWLIYTLQVTHPGTVRILLPAQVDTARWRWIASTVQVRSHRWIPITLPDTALPPSHRRFLRLQQERRALQDSLRVLALEESLRLTPMQNGRTVPVEVLQRFRQDMFSLYRLRRRLTDRLERLEALLQTWRARETLPSRRRYMLRLAVQGTGTLRLAC